MVHGGVRGVDCPLDTGAPDSTTTLPQAHNSKQLLGRVTDPKIIAVG